MTVKCACQNCRGSIAFDAADFAEQNRTSTRIIGQNIRCPHCGYATALMMPMTKWSKASSARTVHVSPALLVILALAGFLIPPGIVVALVKSGVSIHQIVNGGAGVPGAVAMGIAATFGIILAVMWAIFPWLVLSILSNIHDELARIEQNTRHGTVEVLKS
jgi:hypothetical protein